MTAVSSSPAQKAIVDAREVRKEYRLGGQVVRALDGVTLRINPGEFVAIMGPSGSGKSTLMNLIGGLDVPSSGSMSVMGHDLAALTQNQMAQMRNRHIGFVFQQFNLLPRTPALRQVMLPASYAGTARSVAAERARHCLEAVDLAHRIDHCPSELSGGQQQRVAIARALVNDPEILLADEPTGALDSSTSREIMRLFAELNSRGKCVIVVTHDRETASYAERVVTFRDGRIVPNEQTGDGTQEAAA